MKPKPAPSFETLLRQLEAVRVDDRKCITVPVNVSATFDTWLMIAEIANAKGTTIDGVINDLISGADICDAANKVR